MRKKFVAIILSKIFTWYSRISSELLKICHKKGAFFIKLFAEVALMLDKSSLRKWQNIIFNGPYFVKKTFELPEFTLALFYLAYIT